MLKKYYQNDRVTCAACAYGTCLSGMGIYLTEAQCCDEVKTDKRGTFDSAILAALHKRKIEANLVHINQSFEEYGRWLYLNSINRFIYVSMAGQNKGKRGRPTMERHAVCVSNGMVYDSAMKEILPLDAYGIKYNHRFLIELIILIDNPKPEKFLAKGLDTWNY
jgi:hypothetical protein